MNNNELKAIKNLLIRIGEETVNEAKKIAPRAIGNLKKDIQLFKGNLDSLEVEVGNTLLADYAPFVHQGTGKQARGVSKAPHKKGVKARPYLEDALDNYKRDGGLDRALNAAGKTITKDFMQNIKKSFKNITIK